MKMVMRRLWRVAAEKAKSPVVAPRTQYTPKTPTSFPGPTSYMRPEKRGMTTTSLTPGPQAATVDGKARDLSITFPMTSLATRTWKRMVLGAKLLIMGTCGFLARPRQIGLLIGTA